MESEKCQANMREYENIKLCQTHTHTQNTRMTKRIVDECIPSQVLVSFLVCSCENILSIRSTQSALCDTKHCHWQSKNIHVDFLTHTVMVNRHKFVHNLITLPPELIHLMRGQEASGTVNV